MITKSPGKKIFFIFAFMVCSVLSAFAQLNLTDSLASLMPEDFVCREFFSKNPMWINSGLYIQDLNAFKGKILHTKAESYELSADGTKHYGESAGYPVDDTYLIFDSDGVIRYSCKITTLSDGDADHKTLNYTEYSYDEASAVYQITEHSLNGSEGSYVQTFSVEKESDVSLIFTRTETNSETGESSRSTVYRFRNDSFFTYEDCRYADESKKIAFTNELIASKTNRSVTTPRVELKDNALGFLEHYYSHPAQDGSAGRYSLRNTELLSGPDAAVLENFPELFN